MIRYAVDTTRLQDFSAQIGLPVIVVAANWLEHRAVDLDEKAARVFYDVLEATLAANSGDHTPEFALVLVGQGGQCGFADAIRRVFNGLKMTYRVYVPCPSNGTMTLLSLGASHVILHPFGGVGAFDNYRNEHARSSAELLAARMLLTGSHTLDAKRLDQLQSAKIGQGTFLAESDLTRIGIKARTAEGNERRALWDVYQSIEAGIGLTELEQERFTPSEEWPDEVEFAPATFLAAAMIASINRQAVFELDTGRPDPDRAHFHGAWRTIIP